MFHLNRDKRLLAPNKPTSPDRKTYVHLRRLRSFVLPLLLFYAVILIQRLVSTLPPYSVVESETREVFDSLKTHISSTKKPLEVHEENKSTKKPLEVHEKNKNTKTPLEVHEKIKSTKTPLEVHQENKRTETPLEVHEENKSTETPLEVHEESKSSPNTSSKCSSVINGATGVESNRGFLCCDRTHHRTDICYMKGDIRTDSQSSSIILYNSSSTREERIRPYTRKWEASIMNTIDEIRLKPSDESKGAGSERKCDIHHNVSAVMFSTGGYTGNVYHEFNDGLIPLYITGERFGGEVLLVVLEYHSWWMTRYEGIIKKLSKYELVDFKNDQRVHCFKEMIVGLKIHGELTIDPSPDTGKGIRDFQKLLGEGLLGASQTEQKKAVANTRPQIVIFSRDKSRIIQNQREVVKACQQIGFEVQMLNPKRTTLLADIYRLLNAADVMLGVHGAAMTHFLFMRPGSVFIQIVPLGLDWAAEEYFGAPAKKLGLEYMAYRISAEESSLSQEYDRNDPVLVDPASVNEKGWSETKRIYLQKQNINLNMKIFHGVLKNAYTHVKSRSVNR